MILPDEQQESQTEDEDEDTLSSSDGCHSPLPPATTAMPAVSTTIAPQFQGEKDPSFFQRPSLQPTPYTAVAPAYPTAPTYTSHHSFPPHHNNNGFDTPVNTAANADVEMQDSRWRTLPRVVSTLAAAPATPCNVASPIESTRRNQDDREEDVGAIEGRKSGSSSRVRRGNTDTRKSIESRGGGGEDRGRTQRATNHITSSSTHVSNNNNNGNRASGLSSFLGRFSSSSRNGGNSRKRLGAQSASVSKNDFIDLHQHRARPRNGIVPERRHPTNQHQQHSRHRKSGVPGRNGEEPETNIFNFVDVMLHMPEESDWKLVLKKLLKILLVMTVSYFALMSLYFAAEYKSESYMKNFKVLVVDLDRTMIGMQFLTFTQELNKQPGQLDWSVAPTALYPNMSSIREQIRHGNYWGAVVVQPSASSNLNYALSIQDPRYDPTKAFAFVYDSGRNPLVVKPMIVANMYTAFITFSTLFNPAWCQFVLNSQGVISNFNLTALVNAPQILGTPIAFEEFDLHPVTSPIITSATSVAYIWIFLVAGGSTYLVAHVMQPVTRHATVPKTMALLLLPLITFLIVLSMAYSVLLFTFGVPFESGAPQFMALFASMLLLQCSVSALVLFLIFLVPVMFIPAITITFVIMNVIAVFNPAELMPMFYRWVYSMPFLNAVQMARWVLMGSFNRLRYNIPILVTWTLVPIVLLPFAILRQKRLARELEMREEDEDERAQRCLRADDEASEMYLKKTNRRGVAADDSEGDVQDSDDDDSGNNYDENKDDDVIDNPRTLHSNNRRPVPTAVRVLKLERIQAMGSNLSSSTAPSAPSESQVFGRSGHRQESRPAYGRDMIPNEVK
ncbi:hypothetical protein BG011_003762 [Mortierella polycephala]|uniref:DUF3533 domain-containing protein n=1 Tax=Mortierella polycephala TaxID=41804 RepID=A0A9P6Q059_9FUNG|nr:hypothetical protein BG011_003762 [Mortierella polycephala]